MSKWTTIYTNAMTPSNKNSHKVSYFVKNTTSKTLEELKKAGEKAFAAEESRKDSLVQAYEDKKLKSKALIKEAQAVKKARAKAAEKATKKQK